ncbi:DUF2851 family protein [Ekhidna sp.]|uniref:DUF2851 family protein n=1 Tax=Ekhidna sp. TaxID=2608089 RepID=UPI0032991F41
MDEQFLHYIWKYQKFDYQSLTLTSGQSLRVFYQGNSNQDSGPDFEEGRIKIDTIEWAGQIEIHINSSDWANHNHQNDPAYQNVILHVVWNHDKEVLLDDVPIPTLELKNIVDPTLLEKYRKYINAPSDIPCTGLLKNISPFTMTTMLNRTLVERLENKGHRILQSLQRNNNDWEETTYQAIASNFGFATNKESFIRLTEILPFSKLKKVLHDSKQTEALLFGLAGFLEPNEEEYQQLLGAEFEYLRKKFELNDPMVTAQWKFGKLRPGNFPTVRLSQLSSLLHHHPKLFTLLIETEDIKQLKKELLTSVSEYWRRHYDFGKVKKKAGNSMGINSFENLLINTVAPLMAAYAKHSAQQKYMDRAIELLESLPPESNRIIAKWNHLNLNFKNTFDSQAAIELYKSYCQKRRCLHCNVGVELLNK